MVQARRTTRIPIRTRIGRAVEPRIVLQPIISVSTGATLAVEALSRFETADASTVFHGATASGVGPELEARCVTAALARRDELPHGMMLTVNVSPNALPYLAQHDSWPEDLRGVIVEITEQDVDSPDGLTAHLDVLRERGAAIAIDDVSTGYAGLIRLAQMRPDYVKIDRQVVSGVGDDVLQAAVLEALVTLSHRLGAAVIGEGVETLADLEAISGFDVDYAQGFAIARPAARRPRIPADVIAACRANRRGLLLGTGTNARDVARTRDVYAVTAALAAAGRRSDVDVAIRAAATDLDVDMIGVSILSGNMCLREIASTSALDPDTYPLAAYPATLAVLTGGAAAELQLADADGDPAERALMRRLGQASVLVVPLYDEGRAIGVVEFAHCTPRRWSAQDITHARGLADHLSPALRRLGVGALSSRAHADLVELARHADAI